jgi:hypothetical protein
LIPILTGLGLAAAAGLNAWAVLLLFHGLVRLLPQDFPGPVTAMLSSTFVLQLALVLFLTEFIVNKIPFVDRFWEALNTLLRPAAGVLLALSCVPESSPVVYTLLAIAAVAVTFAAHAAKSATRLTSTAATRGLTQVALSLAEDVVAVLLATLLFFQPYFTPFFLAGLLLALLTHWPRVRRGLGVLFFRLQHPRRHNPPA